MGDSEPASRFDHILSSIRRVIENDDTDDSSPLESIPSYASRHSGSPRSGGYIAPRLGEEAEFEPVEVPSRAERSTAEAPMSVSVPETAKDIALPHDTSPAAMSAQITAYAALSRMQVRDEAGKSTSIDGLIADLLQPMLADWIERSLPAMVEKIVAVEVARLSGRG